MTLNQSMSVSLPFAFYENYQMCLKFGILSAISDQIQGMLTLLLQINSQVTSNLRLSHPSVHSRPYFTEIRTNTAE